MRTLVDIPDDKLARVDAIARRHKWSRAEAVRKSLDLLIAEEKAEVRRVLDETAGGWCHLGIDGLEYQRAIRAEWDD